MARLKNPYQSDPEAQAELRQEEIARRRASRDDDFRETLAPPVPNQTYRSRVDYIDNRASVAEQLIRYVAVVLSLLIVGRFIASLFSSDRSNGLVNFFYATTDWIVRPFQALFGTPPSSTGGFFDWPAVAALIVVGVLATLLISLIRPRDYRV
jgi:uncharacterized protein YggT (Ycf19 family)